MAWLCLLTLGLVAVTSVVASPQGLNYLYQQSYEVDSSEHGGEAGAKSTTCPCGWANKVSSRVVNGTETARNEFPFAAGLVYRGTRTKFCGATIITRYHALTATHCTVGKHAREIGLTVGVHNIITDIGGPAAEIPIERILDHAEYISKFYFNDISLLVMEREIKFSQFVGPACLPPGGPRLNLDRQYIKIIGWGAGENQGAMSPILRKVDLRVVPMNECSQAYSSRRNSLIQSQICTYAQQKAACQGDSGGPVVWVDPETNRYTLVGIVSYGIICGDLFPSVQTSVQAYLDWINFYIMATYKPNAQTCTKNN